jgi:hypothetical protein
VVDDQHLPAARNWRADGLSRGISLDSLVEGDPSLAGVPWLDLEAEELVLLCDPRQRWGSDDEFAQFWARVRGLLIVQERKLGVLKVEERNLGVLSGQTGIVHYHAVLIIQ